jgi:hypothetical protein
MASQIKAAQVKTTIVLAGKDRASKEINKATGSLKKMRAESDMAKQATIDLGKAGDRTADTSGKLSTALSSLGDFAGSMEGDMRRASEAAGLLDDVMTVLPGPIGIAAGALTGLAAVLVLNRLESQRTRAAIAEVAPPGMVGQIKDLADALDLNAKGAVALAQAFRDSDEPADQLEFQIRKIVEQAERVGRDASDDVAKFADSLKKADKRAQILRKRLADLTQAQASANDPRIQAFGFGDPTGAMDFQREALEQIEAYEQGVKDARAELQKFRAGLVEQGINLAQRVDLRDKEAALIEKITDLQAKQANAEKRRRRVVKLAAEEERQIIADRAAEFARLEREASQPRRRRRDSGRSKEPTQDPKAVMIDGIDISGILKMKEDEDKIIKWRREQEKKAAEAEKKALRAKEDLALVQARLNGLADQAVEKLRVETELKRKLREIEERGGSKAEQDLARAEAALALREVQRSMAEARLQEERELAEAQQRAIELERQRRMATIDSTASLLDAGAALAHSTGLLNKNDKLQRAILAGRSLADAARETALAASAGAAQNYPKAIAHGLAAAAHVAAAARFRGGGGGGKSSGGASPTVAATRDVARGGQRERGGNVTINLPPGTFVGNEAALAAELKRTMLAAAGTGL